MTKHNKEDDLDFSEVKATVKSKAPPPPSLVTPKAKKAPDYMLTYRDEENRLISKEMMKCTPVEFVLWIKTVYPNRELNVSLFSNKQTREERDIRLEVLKEILKFNLEGHFKNAVDSRIQN